ncbi:MAG: hypothetical protein Q4D33_05075 [Prevotellaceae bacterium]|nr:hypothetical protein [Prevotellaceae bacterium]
MKHSVLYSFVIVIVIVFVLYPQKGRAQFQVVDAEDGKPLACAYLFDAHGGMLGMTDMEGNAKRYKGKVTVSTMSYESQTVDADSFTGVVRLKPSAYSVNEVSVEGNDYIKISVAFRDVFRNDSDLVLFREGIADYYLNTRSNKMQRRIRACRQFEHPDLRKLIGSYPALYDARTLDLRHIVYVERGDVVSQSGDTTVFNANYHGQKSNDALIQINDSARHLYRSVIDEMKLNPIAYNQAFDKLFKMSYRQNIIDWSMADPSRAFSSLIGCRAYREIVHGKKHPVTERTMLEVATIGITALTKEEAKEEMKEKKGDIPHDFDMPHQMPAAPFDVAAETASLIERDFWTM